MSLIKCNECGNNISTKALECMHCGAPVSLDDEVHKNYIKTKEYKLISHPLSIIVTTLLFVTLLGLISSNLVFLNTIRGEITLQQATMSSYYQEYINTYPTIIINVACISCIVSCLSKKLNIFAKLGYLINIIISILLFYILYTNNIRVDICYFLIILINTLLFIIPIKYKLKYEDILIEKNKESKLEKKNNKIKKQSTDKLITKKSVLVTIVFLIIESISIAIILFKNDNDIYKETIIQANSDFQIKIINNYINIRSDSNVESKVIGSVNKGDIYNVLDITGKENHIWYKIDYKGKIGYIASPRTEPYIKELFSDKLVVNVFCTTDNDNCSYLMEFILKYQKSTAKSFLIQYQDLTDKNTEEIYNKVRTYHNVEESIPLIVIGNNIITNYTKDSEFTLVEVIESEMNNKTNIVNEIKKGNQLPKITE